MSKRNRQIIAIALSPFAFLYWLAVVIRHFFYDKGFFKTVSFSIPLICVGNITVGGTGKTPLVEYLIRLLKDDFKTAVLSRGYKRKTSHFIRADQHSTADEIGDEPRQIKQKFPGIEVAVDADRVAGVRRLLDEVKALDLILLDDAFQHRRIKAGLNILLVDYNRPILDDFILPAGRLRDTVNQRKRADVLIITKCPENLTEIEKGDWGNKYIIRVGQQIFFSYLTYEDLIPLFSNQKPISFQDITSQKISILLFTGIADPEPIITELKKYSDKVYSLNYPDHHLFTSKDLQLLKKEYYSIQQLGKIVVTTEKDATRLQLLKEEMMGLDIPVYQLPVRVDFLFNEKEKYNALVREYCVLKTHRAYVS